jgi:integrase
MAKKNLTDRFIKSRKAAPKGKRVDYRDGLVPGLALQVTDSAHKSFVLVARFSHKKDRKTGAWIQHDPLNHRPTRRTLGDYGALSLDDARTKAKEWIALIGRGIDPRMEEGRQRALEARKQVNSFAAIAAEFLDRHASGLAKADEAKRIIESEFVKPWGARPIGDILPEEAAAAIRAIVKRGAPYQAHNAFGYLRRLFNRAIGTNEFGITSSPVEHLRPSDLIGKREARHRVLRDDELRAVWDAAGAMGYPYGPLFQLLILTGQREREVADMRWSEIDLGKRLWTIPASRMKSGATHEVPLTSDMIAILEALPKFNSGNYVFTTTSGVKPVNGFSKAKTRIDKLSGVPQWKIHDLRRSMRTHLSALPVQDLVRELIIAHAKPGLHKVYDQHAYQDEKRECLRLWELRLQGIVSPAPAGVTSLDEHRTGRAQSGMST